MFFFLLGCLVWCQTPDAADEKRAEVQSRIATLDSEMTRLKSHVRRLSADSRSLAQEIEELELERAIIASQIEKTQLQLQLTDRELDQMSSQKSVLERKIEAQKNRLILRLRSVYKRGQFGYAQIFLKQSQLDDLINAYHYSRFLTKKDHQAFNTFRKDLAKLEETVKALELTRHQAQLLNDALTDQETQQKQLLRKRSATLQRIGRAKDEKRQLMEDLKLEKEELEYVLEGLLSGDTDSLQRHLPISRYKGRLEWPAKGPVLREFGVIRDPEFKTMRKQNGIDIDLDPGTPVRAVFSGRVIYADWFKSYGNLIIIDHGNQVASFYAHNAQLTVTRGQSVEKNETIGFSGDTGSLIGPFLHFELRSKGKPEDPRNWLKPL